MKKGVIAITTVVELILIVVSMLAILNFIIQGYSRVDNSYNAELCRASVVANSKLNQPLFGQGAWPIQCPTIYYYFDVDGFIVESGDVKQEIRYTTQTRDLRAENKEYVSCMKNMDIKDSNTLDKETICKIRNINVLLSEAHARCWEQFGRGQLALFDKLDSERQCVVCAVYDFSDKFQKEVGGSFVEDIVEEQDTFDYIMRTTGPLGRDITYAELSNDELDVYDPPYYSYSFDESYASLFIANNEDYINTKVGQAADLVGKLLKLDLGGDEGEVYFLNTNEFIPESKVARECDVLVEQ